MPVGTVAFPTTLDTAAELIRVANLASSTIGAGGVNSSATTVPVTDTSTFNTDGVAWCGTEAISYTGKTSTSLTGCVRGFDATTAASHAAADPIYGDIITSKHHEVHTDAILALESALGPSNGTMAARALNDRGGQVYNVKAWGAAGDHTADDTAAIQAAIDAVPAGGQFGAIVYFPPGRYLHTGLTANKKVTLQGAGAGATFLINTHASNTSITMNMTGIGDITTGGGVRDLTVCAGDLDNLAVGTNSGDGIAVTGCNGDYYLDHVSVRNHATCVRLTNCFVPIVTNFTFLCFATNGLLVEGDATASIYASQGKISNFGATGTLTSSVGIRWTAGGGFYVDSVDLTSTNIGLLVQPGVAATTAYGFFHRLLCDTCISDNIDINATSGFITSLHFTDSWGAYSDTGYGLRTRGANLDGVIWTGGALRQNAKHGWSHEGGINVRLSNVEIANNSKLTTNTYDGVNVAASVTQWAVMNSRIGNFASGLATVQRYGINCGASVDNLNISGNDLRLNQTAAMNGLVPSATIQMVGNLPDSSNMAFLAQSGGTLSGAFQLVMSSAFPFTNVKYGADATPGVFQFLKTRHASAGQTVLQNNDGIARIEFAGSDGTGYIASSRIEGVVDGTPGTNDMPGRLVFSTTPDASATPTEALRINNAQRVSIATAADPTAVLHLKAGAAAASSAPLKFTAGTLLTTPEVGTIEYTTDGFFFTGNATNGRGDDNSQQVYYLGADRGTIGATIADYFAANSGIPYLASSTYEIVYHLYYTKTTAGTVTYTFTTTTAPTRMKGWYVQTPVGGVGTAGTAQIAANKGTTATTLVLPATGSLTTAVDHQAEVTVIINSNTAGNIRLRVTESAGTITPLADSYVTVRRVPSGGVGIFVA